MKRLILFLFLVSGLLFGRDYYQKDRILFCLQKDLPYLEISYENGIARTTNPTLNVLLTKYKITELKRFFTSADAGDVVGDTDLSRVYSAAFKTHREWDELWAMISEFKALSEIISGDLSSINYPMESDPQWDPYTPDDTRYGEQWFINKVQADYAWGLWLPGTPGDTDVLAAVVDTGLDTEHPDLQDQRYLNPGEDLNGNGVVDPSDENGVDDDGNGYVDDFYGWDFADNDNDIRPPDAGPDQELSHGTHCAGIVSATTDNATGVSGISFRSKVISTKQARDTDTENPGIYYGYDGILYVAKLGAKFINCSWGGSYISTYERNILDDVSDNYGAIVVGAAGNDEHDNDTYPQYPSDYSKCISVAATTLGDKKAYYSNWGSVIDISAPGGEGAVSSSAILSTIHDNAGSYAAWQGTSMAAPVVTGSFALLKAWFPSASRQWLIDELLAQADNIDDQNPDYIGELGSGRVNVYNSIARNSFPYLTITNRTYEVYNDDGDGQLNPGESANLNLTIHNDDMYQDAASTTVTLSATNPYITFVDDNEALGTITAGSSVSTTTGDLRFSFTEDAPMESLYIHVTMDANPTADHPYSYTDSVGVICTMNQVGFPKTDSEIKYPTAAADILGDSDLEVIAYGENDSLYVYLSDGTLATGFPVYIGYTTMGPAVADVDNDGEQEIVIVERNDAIVKIIKNDGTLLLDHKIDEQLRGDIALCNLDSDPELEIVFMTYNRNLYALNIDGTNLPNFPVGYNAGADQGVAVGDVTGDGVPEMVFGLVNSDLYIVDASGNTLSGFPLDMSSRVNATPVIADIKGETFHIIVATNDKKIQSVSLSGTVEWQYDIDGYVRSGISLSDFNRDGTLDIAFGTDAGSLYVLDINGNLVAPFPLSLNGDVRTAPVFADFDNDGDLEIVCGTDGGSLYIHETDGSLYKNFPADFGVQLQGSPCVADIDADGDLEVVIGGDNGLNVVDIKDAKGSSTNLWQTFQADNKRSSYFYYPGASAIDGGDVFPEAFALLQNYPNPFNPQTTIKYNLAEAADVTLTIYNVMGQRVRTLVNEKQEPGFYAAKWDGKNDFGHTASSGVYFYKMQLKQSGNERVFQKKMLLIR